MTEGHLRDQVYPGLWQGCRPKPTDFTPDDFDVLVWTDCSYQPPREDYPGRTMLYCPMWDDHENAPPSDQIINAVSTAGIVAGHLDAKRRVLTTCFAGHNRSGLVNALALLLLQQRPGQPWIGDVVERIQSAREGSLFNKGFVRLIRTIKLDTFGVSS